MSFWTKVRNVVTKVAPVAIGYALTGTPVGAAIGGAVGSAARGGDIGQIIQGAGYGYGAGSLYGAGANALAGTVGTSEAAQAAAGDVIAGGGSNTAASLAGTAANAGIPTSLSNLSPSNILSTAGNAITGGGSSGSGGVSLSNLLQGANIAGNIYGASTGAKAAKTAAGIQAESVDKALATQKEALAQTRADLQPYAAAGASTVPRLTSLVNDPNAQLDFIQNNPFYNALAERAKRELLSSQATKGKLASGGTAKALQESLLLLGSDLLSRDITQKQNLAQLGVGAAGGQGTATTATGADLANLITSKGAVSAAGTVGAANAQTQAINNLLKGATSIYGIDKGIRA